MFYESHPGAASRCLPKTYQRREPENTLLYELVSQHLETLLARAREESDHGFPSFVEKEFRRYLQCGLLCHGFARVACRSCSYEHLLAFSCKGKTVCPSCGARRMHDTVAHLVDRVLPPVLGYRQWVVSFPRKVRFLLARDQTLLSWMIRAFTRCVFAWQRRKAKKLHIRHPLVGSVAFVQRFGQELNLNVHLHCIFPDGVFTVGPDGERQFHPLDPPSDDEVTAILAKLVRRAGKRLTRREPPEPAPDDVMAQAQAIAVHAVSRTAAYDPPHKRRCAYQDGFSLHADTALDIGDGPGLERLLLYAARPAVSLSRLANTDDGRVTLRLKRPARSGARQISFLPVDLLRRLAILIPPPRRHAVRYLGCFSSHHAARSHIVPSIDSDAAKEDDTTPRMPVSATLLARRLNWAALLLRVHKIDVTICRKCGGDMKVLAFLFEPQVVRQILTHLQLPLDPPTIAASRGPPQGEFPGWCDEDFVDPPSLS